MLTEVVNFLALPCPTADTTRTLSIKRARTTGRRSSSRAATSSRTRKATEGDSSKARVKTRGHWPHFMHIVDKVWRAYNNRCYHRKLALSRHAPR